MFPPPSNRSPKIKEFVRAPYVVCPECHTESFGILSIFGRHYVRRCTSCWYDGSFPLPTLRKKIIYLDQFVISNIAKELDPKRSTKQKGDQRGFYKELFELLDRLSKLQLIVCPDSPIQDNESIVTGEHYEKLRRVFRHLSHGVGFRDPSQIRHVLIYDAFEKWCGKKTEPKFSDHWLFTGNPHSWNDVFRIEMNYKIEGFPEALRAEKERLADHLQKVCENCLKVPSFDFHQTFIDEMIDQGSILIDNLVIAQTRQRMVMLGEAPLDDIYLMLSPEVSLVTRMLGDIRTKHTEETDPCALLEDFFRSADFQSVSAIRLSALCWATILRHVRIVQNPAKFPRASAYNDVAVFSSYAPFCDAMFLDKEFAHFTDQSELRQELNQQPRVFSLRRESKSAFLEYLRSIEREASPEHLSIIAAVYGERHEQPFVELLGLH